MRCRSTTRATPLLLCAAVAIGLTLGITAAHASDVETCAACHEDISRVFQATVHGRIAGFETRDGVTGCATCHGDGVAHVESGGELAQIVRFTDDTPVARRAEPCLTCHRSEGLHDWDGNVHQLNDVSCEDCHAVHRLADDQPGDPDVCYACHQDTRAQFEYPSHHPLREGAMSCGSCHDPHGSSIGLLRTDERPQDLCFTCHAGVQGPFVFEHEPVAEGCDTCHAPHGAVANNLLIQNEPFLCLQCHEMHFHSGLEAEDTLTARVPRYDPANGPADGITYPGGEVPNPWGQSGYRRAFTSKCTQCHTHVHGSDQPSQTVPGLGQGLMR